MLERPVVRWQDIFDDLIAWPICDDPCDWYPDLRIRVVQNQPDGIVAFEGHGDPRVPVDSTTAERPFIFWINNDQDDKRYYETTPVKTPDLSDNAPNSLRDLEDFTRLHLGVGKGTGYLQDTNSYIVLAWRPGVAGAP